MMGLTVVVVEGPIKGSSMKILAVVSKAREVRAMVEKLNFGGLFGFASFE